MRKAQHKTILTAVTAFLALSASSLAQTAPAPISSNASDSSLGSVARSLKGGKAAPTKRVFSNDDMEASDEPLPRLDLNISRRDNSAEIVAAIVTYHQTHTLKQTEETVHAWFDLYDQTLADAILGFNEHQSARQTNAKTMHEPCPTGEFAADCEKEQQAAVHNLMKSDPVLNQDNRTIGRIQNGLKNIRDGLRMKDIRYRWFTIRASDGYGAY